jgi:OOP family OmpA-OmpF porin
VAGEANDDPKKNGCPPDRDGDTIIDAEDACPDIPGIHSDDKEQNGCPGDKDGDGIRDDKDACPEEKGKPDPDPQKNGCPSLVRVTKTEIVILQQVQFKTGSDVILAASDELLGQVASVLSQHTQIKRLEVQGHTDNRGSAAYNKKLSERRAASVVRWLTERGGIDADRLTAKGYGMDQPLDDNSTDAGRQRNRRVQFKIIDMERSGDTSGTGE